jgi:hypothetical protein
MVALLLVLGPWLVWRIPAVWRVAPLAVVQILAGVPPSSACSPW